MSSEGNVKPNANPAAQKIIQSPKVMDIARENLTHLWERAAKIVVPLAAVGSFVSDVLSPIAPFVTILLVITSILCMASGIVWFGFKRSEIKSALSDGVIDENEFKSISSVNAWSVAFAFNLVASLILMIFFGAQKVIAQAQPEKTNLGAVASVFPNVVHFQNYVKEELLGIKKTTERIEATTSQIKESNDRIETKTDEMRVTIENIDKKVQDLSENGLPDAKEEMTSQKNCQENQTVSPYGKVYEGIDVVLEMAELTEKNEFGLQNVVMKVKGPAAFEAGIDGKSIKYVTKSGFGGGTDFVYKVGDSEPVRMILRNSSEGELARVFLKDNKAIDLKLNRQKSKKLCPSSLL